MIVRPFGFDDRERFGGLPVFMSANSGATGAAGATVTR